MTWSGLAWSFPPNTGAVLTFDKVAWKMLEFVANEHGIAAEEMISAALSELLSPLVRQTVQ